MTLERRGTAIVSSDPWTTVWGPGVFIHCAVKDCSEWAKTWEHTCEAHREVGRDS